MNILTKVFRNGEVGRMLAVFSSFETIHIEAYSYILESLKLPDSTYHEFLEIEEMREKHDFLKQYNADTLKDLIMTLGCFAAFVEGLQLFASFAMLLSYPKKGRMRNMGQIVSWSIRDETIHVNAGIKQLQIGAWEGAAHRLGQRLDCSRGGMLRRNGNGVVKVIQRAQLSVSLVDLGQHIPLPRFVHVSHNSCLYFFERIGPIKGLMFTLLS